jgi:hypothetical protein
MNPRVRTQLRDFPSGWKRLIEESDALSFSRSKPDGTLPRCHANVLIAMTTACP